MKKLIYIFIFGLPILVWAQKDVQIESNQKARLYFTEAEKRYNQNDYSTALEYIKKTEDELGDTNGRVLNLKIKAQYNSGLFEKAQESLVLFFDEYSDGVTTEIRTETEEYFLKLERYFEQKAKEENKKLEEKRNLEESLKHYSYVDCPVSSCNSGHVEEFYNETCYSCEGSGKITKYDMVQAFANGLNGTNYNTSYKVTCEDCNGYGKIRQSRYVSCSTCEGKGKVLKYVGSAYVSDADQSYSIRNNKGKIDYYIDLKENISYNSSVTIFPIKDFNTNKYGLCDRNLKLVTPYKYDDISVISDQFAKVKLNSKFGLNNNKNEIILPLEYQEIKKVSNTSLLLKKSDTWVLTDYKGNKLGDKVDAYSAWEGQYIVFKKGTLYAVMDYNGKVVQEAIYTDMKLINSTPFVVAFKDQSGWKLFKLSNSIIDLLKESYREVEIVKTKDSKLILLKNVQNIKIAKLDGTLVLNSSLSQVTYKEKLDFFILERDQLYGLYDASNGKLVYPKYEGLYVYDYCPQRAVIKNSNGLFGVIDTSEKTIIPDTMITIWFETNKDSFITQEKENSRKRLVYDHNGVFLYDYKADK